MTKWEKAGRISESLADALFDKAFCATGRRDEFRAWAIDVHNEKVGSTDAGPTFRIHRDGFAEMLIAAPAIETPRPVRDEPLVPELETEGVDVSVARWLLSTLAEELMKEGNEAAERVMQNGPGSPAARLVSQLSVNRSYGVAHILNQLARSL